MARTSALIKVSSRRGLSGGAAVAGAVLGTARASPRSMSSTRIVGPLLAALFTTLAVACGGDDVDGTALSGKKTPETGAGGFGSGGATGNGGTGDCAATIAPSPTTT